MIKILVNNFASIHHLFQFHSVFSVLIGLIDSNYFSLQRSTVSILNTSIHLFYRIGYLDTVPLLFHTKNHDI